MFGQTAKTAKESLRCRGGGYAAVIAALLSAAAAQGAEVEKDVPLKPAWRWTLNERLAARFDPEAIAAREAEDEAEQDAIHERRQRRGGDLLAEEKAKMTGPPPAVETIDGSKNPELFLPLELFSALLNRGLPGEKWEGLEESRKQIEQRAAALGFGRDLWNRLEGVSALYLRLLHNEDRRRLATGAKDYKRKNDRLRVCRARVRAMEAAKAEFSEEGFLRLLYEAVAPDVRRTYILEPWPPDYQRHAEELRFQEEGGCR